LIDGAYTVTVQEENEKRKIFLEFILSVLLIPEHFNTHMINFVEKTITKKYFDSRPMYISSVHEFSSPYNPIVFHLTASVEEPSSDLTKLADLQGIASSKVKFLALSRYIYFYNHKLKIHWFKF
jgi:hypothetical protein